MVNEHINTAVNKFHKTDHHSSDNLKYLWPGGCMKRHWPTLGRNFDGATLKWSHLDVLKILIAARLERVVKKCGLIDQKTYWKLSRKNDHEL